MSCKPCEQQNGLGAIGPIPLQFDPGELTDLQRKLRAVATGTNADVAACKSIPQSTKDAWGSVYQEWQGWDSDTTLFLRTYAAVSVVTFGSPGFLIQNAYRAQGFLDRGLAIQASLHDWQTKLVSLGCALTTPIVDVPQAPGEREANWIKAIEIGAIAVGVLSAAVLLTPLVREGVAMLGAARKTVTASENPISRRLRRAHSLALRAVEKERSARTEADLRAARQLHASAHFAFKDAGANAEADREARAAQRLWRRIHASVARENLPSANVYWRDLGRDTHVELVGKPGTRAYVAVLPSGRRAVVYWEGREALSAQRYLDELVRRTRRRT
jgi:hypothetical protein